MEETITKTKTLKCESAICDASTYLQTIEAFEKKYNVIRRIECAQMQMMENPLAKRSDRVIGLNQPREIPGVFIPIVFIYEEKV